MVTSSCPFHSQKGLHVDESHDCAVYSVCRILGWLFILMLVGSHCQAIGTEARVGASQGPLVQLFRPTKWGLDCHSGPTGKPNNIIKWFSATRRIYLSQGVNTIYSTARSSCSWYKRHLYRRHMTLRLGEKESPREHKEESGKVLARMKEKE